MGKEKPKQMAVQQTTAMFQGPIPPPSLLKHYDEIIPGSAERILKMSEKQSEHRQHLERAVVTSGIRNAQHGQVFGLIIGLGGLASATILGVFGQPWAASLIGAGTLTGLVSVFVYGSQKQTKELQEGQK